MRDFRRMMAIPAAALLVATTAHAGLRHAYSADADTDGDSTWEDIGSDGNRNWSLDAGVTRVPITGVVGVDWAYDFPGDAGGTTSTFKNATNRKSTFELLFNFDSLPDSLPPGATDTAAIIFESGGLSKGLSFSIGWSGGGRNWIEFKTKTSPDVSIQYDVNTADNDVWFHLVGVVDPDTPATRLFVNGVEVTPAGTAASNWDGGGDDSGIGRGTSGGTGGAPVGKTGQVPLDGQIALLNHYDNEAWGQTEVTNAYNALIPEPATLTLIGIGGLVMVRRRSR